MSGRLHYAPYAHGAVEDAREAHDERVMDHQDGFCHAQQTAGKKAGEPWRVPPCGQCPPCKTIRKALDWRAAVRADDLAADEDPTADAWELISGLCERVEEAQAGRRRAEDDLSWQRRQNDELRADVDELTAELERWRKEADAWKREAWAADEDREAA